MFHYQFFAQLLAVPPLLVAAFPDLLDWVHEVIAFVVKSLIGLWPVDLTVVQPDLDHIHIPLLDHPFLLQLNLTNLTFIEVCQQTSWALESLSFLLLQPLVYFLYLNFKVETKEAIIV